MGCFFVLVSISHSVCFLHRFLLSQSGGGCDILNKNLIDAPVFQGNLTKKAGQKANMLILLVFFEYGTGRYYSGTIARIMIAKQSGPGFVIIRGYGRDSTLIRATIICRTSNENAPTHLRRSDHQLIDQLARPNAKGIWHNGSTA